MKRNKYKAIKYHVFIYVSCHAARAYTYLCGLWLKGNGANLGRKNRYESKLKPGKNYT